MPTDKQAAARRLIHAAVRMVIYREDPLAIQLITWCCYDLIREFAEAKGLQLKSNLLAELAVSERQAAVRKVKYVQRFLKHSRTDHDKTIDESNIVEAMDLSLAVVIDMYREAFCEQTHQMKLFMLFVIARYPGATNEVCQEFFFSRPYAEQVLEQGREASLDSLKDLLESRAELRFERKDDLASLSASGDNRPQWTKSRRAQDQTPLASCAALMLSTSALEVWSLLKTQRSAQGFGKKSH